IESTLLKLLRAACDLCRIGHGVAADVHPSVDDAVIDSQSRRQAVHTRIGGAERTVSGLGGHHVESRHRLRKMHRVVEPETLVVPFAELRMVGVGGLRPFGPRHDLQRAGQGKPCGLLWCFHGERTQCRGNWRDVSAKAPHGNAKRPVRSRSTSAALCHAATPPQAAKIGGYVAFATPTPPQCRRASAGIAKRSAGSEASPTEASPMSTRRRTRSLQYGP